MKIKLLSIIFITAIAASGCLKDSQQPVTHLGDVNISLIGTWTSLTSVMNYYDATGNKVYSVTEPLIALQFNNTTSLVETTPSGTAITQDYTLSTVGNTDYINIAGGDMTTSEFAITSLQQRTMTLIETNNYASPLVIPVNGNNITYSKTTLMNTYRKNNLPMN